MYSGKGVGTLYVVATPIGNLDDITLRAIKVLKGVDLIACEDTRRTKKLLSHLGIEGKKLISYHEHNEKEQARKLVSRLKEGLNVALVSDAGTPCISDPGYRLVNLSRSEGIPVVPVPGPSAVIAALSASGFPTDRFFFGGFLPRREKALFEELKEAFSRPFTSVYYESPHRLERTLRVISENFPESEIGLYREITKLNEEFLKGRAEDVLRELLSQNRLKGEIVILIPPGEGKKVNSEEVDIDTLLKKLLKEGFSVKEAAKEAARRTGLPKRELYRRALELSVN